jgi:hypothetical protein
MSPFFGTSPLKSITYKLVTICVTTSGFLRETAGNDWKPLEVVGAREK